jgi:hypothetical protein
VGIYVHSGQIHLSEELKTLTLTPTLKLFLPDDYVICRLRASFTSIFLVLYIPFLLLLLLLFLFLLLFVI